MLYRKIPQCRVCKSAIGGKIDQELLAKVTYAEIIRKFGSHFPADGPLTVVCLRSHRKHFETAVQTAAIDAVAQSRGSATSTALTPHDPSRQRVFQNAVRTKVNEAEVMESLVHSGLRDLDLLEPEEDEDAFRLLNRDRVRRNTASIVTESAKLKAMSLALDEERHRMEKGRMVFRMFELFRRAMEVCPIEYRSVMVTQLKSEIRNDDEVNALLKEQDAKAREIASPVVAEVPAPADDVVTDEVSADD